MKKPHETTASRAARTATPRQRSATVNKSKTSDPLEEIRALRREVAQLQRQLQQGRTNPTTPASPGQLQPWLQIAATVGITLALGKVMQALRLPAAAAVAVPMITAELNRKLF